MPALDPRDRLRRFVLRGRKLAAHSIVQEHPDLLMRAAKGTGVFLLNESVKF